MKGNVCVCVMTDVSSYHWGCPQSQCSHHYLWGYPGPDLSLAGRANAESERKQVQCLNTMVIMSLGCTVYGIIYMWVRVINNTCLAALYSICSLRGAWRPWMFLSVLKFILSWLSWNWCHIIQAGVTLCLKMSLLQCNYKYRVKVNNIFTVGLSACNYS